MASRTSAGGAWAGIRIGLVALAALGAACSGSSEKSVESNAQGILAGSLFESGDGNLVVDAAGRFDWANAPNLIQQPDRLTGEGDDAFGQGTKEDAPAVTVVSDSIPPNKSDLTRFYVAHEVAGDFFLYIAWQRSNTLGSANMDFEFNQEPQADLADPAFTGATTIDRSAGDMLITFDFVRGGEVPVLGLLRWVTTGAASQCYASNAVPCWGNYLNLSEAGFADGAINLDTVTDPITGASLPAKTFGEAAINLTDAGVVGAGECFSFASVFLKSRSSASFPSEVKDFVPPTSTGIDNCGTVRINKTDDAATALDGAVFSLFIDNEPFGPEAGGTQTAHGPEDTLTAHTCTSGETAAGACSISGLLFGNYWAVETTGIALHDPAPDQAFALTSSTPDLTLTLPTFVNPRQFGALKIIKTGKDARCTGLGAPDSTCVAAGVRRLANTSFTVKDAGGATVANLTTGADGTVCLDKNNALLPDALVLGPVTLSVAETAAPTGYALDPTATRSATLSLKADCSAASPNPPSEVSFTNDPLSEITVSFTSLAGLGVTTARIQCSGDATDEPLPQGTPRTLTNLPPGTYNCTIVVDP